MNNIFGIPANTLLYILIVLLGLIAAGVAYTAWRYRLPFRLGMRNLPRRKGQTALIVSGLALSTLIITSALGIGDTVDYSVRSAVYTELGAIDQQIGATTIETAAGFGIGSGPAATGNEADWFDTAVADDIAGLVDGPYIDAAVVAAIQRLPVANSRSNLSEAAVELRGIGRITGEGLAMPEGLAALAMGEVLVNASLAQEIDAQVGDELLLIKGMPTMVKVAAIVPDGELAGAQPSLIASLEWVQTFFDQPGQATAVFVSNAGNPETGVNVNEQAIAQLAPVTGELIINSIKADQLEAAAAGAEYITTLFITFGTFSIVSGILLIFLIFSVLAAERRSELGISRAIGLQRTDLIRQFVIEGLAYDFLAAVMGATLGLVASLSLAGLIATLLGGSGLDIVARVSPRSVFIGYALGLVITFITVTISAVQISQVNIIAAIRSLNLPVPPRLPQWTLFLQPFTVWRAAVQKAGDGHGREALQLFLLAGPKAILSFWTGLAARGPLMLALGYGLAWIGVNVAEQSGVYGLGVSLFFIGLGQLAVWLRLPVRAAYSATGLMLILYWSLPFRDVGRLAELGRNPGDFFISGMFLVGGSILIFLYNADALLNLFATVLGRRGRLLPVARMAIAYPLMAKGRTATTLAMFSLIIFTLVGTTTITNTFSNFLDTESGSGGYDVMIQSNPFNPVSVDQFTGMVDELVSDGQINEPVALVYSLIAPVTAQSPNMSQPANYLINAVNDDFLATHHLALGGIAQGYSTSDEVWAALARDPSLVVIDSFSIDRSGDPSYQPDPDAFSVTSIRASDNTFAPIVLEINGRDGLAQSFTVIGTLTTAPSFYGAMMNEEAAANLGYEGANRYYLRLSEGQDARMTANMIESAFSRSGLQTSLLKEQLEDGRNSVKGVFYLIQGFIGLGLLIGIAALGVITIRAVVERRQQIGVLRAIGFEQGMVQNVFLLEGLFIAGLGTIIGYVLALTFSYNLYLQVAADQGLAFLPPWPILIGIGVTIFTASLITAWLPARATARVVIAEALRYE